MAQRETVDYHSRYEPTHVDDPAKERGRKRSEHVRITVRAVLSTIEDEIRANSGVYPYNNGSLSSAEIARRAGIHPTTFFTAAQRSLGAEVKAWMKSNAATHVASGPVRRNLQSRIADWKKLYNGLAQSHRDTELTLHQTLCELAEVRASLKKSLEENEVLKKQLTELSPRNIYRFTTRD